LDALAKVKARNRLHFQLKSGLMIAYHLPDVARCIVDAEAFMDASQLWKTWECKQAICAQMLDAVDGEELTERDDRRAIVAALTPDERNELYALATPAPAAEEPQDWEEAGAANEKAWLEAVPRG